MKKIFYGFMILALFSACKKKGNDEPQVSVPIEVTITASMGQMTGGATDDKSWTFEGGLHHGLRLDGERLDGACQSAHCGREYPAYTK